MQARSRELLWAFLAILLITLLYTGVVTRFGAFPAASGFFGHSLGVVGFLLMLSTETLYSLRKRSRTAKWGRMSSWLHVHIFTGLVGPYMVLLHSAWKFNGLAGVVLLLTVVIVISGFIGRYIYTAVPRTADGVELQARELGEQIRQVEDEIDRWTADHPPATPVLGQQLAALPDLKTNSPLVVLDRLFVDLNFRIDWWREQRRLNADLRQQTTYLEKLARQRRSLHRQMSSLAAARRLLAVWHAVHIPIGVALFIAAFVHVTAAIYYATLIH